MRKISKSVLIFQVPGGTIQSKRFRLRNDISEITLRKEIIQMKKTYEKPEIEMVSLAAQEAVTNDLLEGEMGVESSIFG